MASNSKALVSTILLATILLFSMEVNASRGLNEQTHNKVSKGPENDEKFSAEIGFSVGNNNNGGDTIGGFLPGNRYPGTGYYGNIPRGPFLGNYPGYGGGLPGYGGYIGNP